MSQPPEAPYYEVQHTEAVRNGELSYVDAKTGYLVFTALFLKERGYCCEAGCRHCPFGYSRR